MCPPSCLEKQLEEIETTKYLIHLTVMYLGLQLLVKYLIFSAR